MTTVSSETDGIKCCSPLSSVPRHDDQTRIRFAARGKHTTLDIHVLPLPSGPIDSPSGTVDVTVHGETEINLKGTANTADWTPFGMSSVKRGDWALLAVAFSITELLSALTTAADAGNV